MAKRRSQLITLVAIIIIIGVYLDILVSGGISIILVNSNYIFYVYAALATIAALSATMLTVIINSFDNKYYGFTLKEIVGFNNEYIKISNAIPVALISIFFATFFLAVNMINTIVSILFGVLFIVISMSVYIWELSSNDKFCYKLVKREIKRIVKSNDEVAIAILFSKLFDSYILRVEQTGIRTAEETLDILINAIEETEITEPIGMSLDLYIGKAFNRVGEQAGFIIAIDKVLKLYNYMDPEFKKYDRRVILLKPIERIRYISDQELTTSSIVGLSNGLDSQDTIDDFEKVFILYQYFKNVYLNEVLSRKVRKRLLTEQIEHLTDFSWSDENIYDSVKQKTLVYIVKDYVLTNKDIEESKEIFIEISKRLYSNGYSKSVKLFESIALIYLAIYVYSECEIETLKQEHREKLKTLINEYEEDIHTNKISFKVVLHTYYQDVVKALWNLSEHTISEYSFMEFFPLDFVAKSPNWNLQTSFNFAIYSYFLSYYQFAFPPYDMIDDWENNANRIFYLKQMIEFFNPETNKRLEIISSWIEKNMIFQILCKKICLRH